MTSPSPSISPFGFGPVTDPAAVPLVKATADTAAAASTAPDLGRVVSWGEHDVYDEHQPDRTRYGVVVGYDEHGAAQVLALGTDRHLAHFPAASVEGYDGITVGDLTVIG